MSKSLEKLIAGIASREEPVNETSSLTRIIKPVLEVLGWDVINRNDENEVTEQESVAGGGISGGRGSADIALFDTVGPRRCVCVLEAKKPKVDLGIREVEQVLLYGDRLEADICVLSNAIYWWMFLPRASGEPMARCFAKLSLYDDAEQVASELRWLMGRDDVVSGEAEARAEDRLESPSLAERPADVVSGVVAEMLSRPHPELLNLVEKLANEAGGDPTRQRIAEALRSAAVAGVMGSQPQAPSDRPDFLSAEPPKKRRPRVPVEWTFCGVPHTSKSRGAFAREFCIELWKKHSDNFEPAESVTKGRYLSKIKMELDLPHRIDESPYYAEKNFDAVDSLAGAYWLLEQFGHTADDLIVHYAEGVIGPGNRKKSDPEIVGRAPRPTGYTLFSVYKRVSSHALILVGVAEELLDRHSESFEKVLPLPDNAKPFITRDPDLLRAPRELKTDEGESIGFYLEADLMGKEWRIRWLCEELLTAFGHSPDDLHINFTPDG